MASCTAITYVNGKLVGDPLDVSMFQSSGWVLDESVEDNGFDQMVIAYVYPSAEDQEVIRQLQQLSSDTPSEDEKEQRKAYYKNALIRRFDFSSSLQRMSVICKNHLDHTYKAFVKGSPEKIGELCRPETLPVDYLDVL